MKRNWGVIVLIGLAFIAQMAIVVLSGSHYCNGDICGTYFWGAHEHDGVWHLALINSGLVSWQARFPTFAGAMLTGYNALLDYCIKGLSVLSGIGAIHWYFKIIPVVWFALMIAVWRKFAANYQSTNRYWGSLLFFIFWGNSLSYLLRYYHEGVVWGGSGLLSMQSPQMLTNIQYALTLPLFGLLLILMMRKVQSWRSALGIGIITMIIMGLKFYGGVIAGVMVGVYAIMTWAQKKYKLAFITAAMGILGFGIATFIFYNPLNSLGGSAILSLKPLATVHPLIEEAGLIYLPLVANLRNNLAAVGISYRGVLIEIATLGLFIIFNWGTRLIGFFTKKWQRIDGVIVAGVIAGLLMNILFVQRGEWWNTVQFLYYATFLSNILAAKVLAEWLDGKMVTRIMAVGVILITIPNGIDTLRMFTSFPPHSYVSDTEMKALNHLKQLPEGIVLALPIDPVSGHEGQLPRPIYNKYDSAYVAAFSGKQTYLNDLVQLRLTDIDYSERIQSIKRYDCSVLDKVKYIYVAGNKGVMLGWKKCQNKILKIEFENEEADIYSVITETPNQ